MKEVVRFGFVLSIICIAAAGLLAGVNALTRPRIMAQAAMEEEAGLKDVFPAAERFEPVRSGTEVVYYKAFDKNNTFAGAVFKAQGKGYSSVIETMAGITLDGSITGVKVISQNETPGMGAQVAEQDFLGRFRLKPLSGIAAVDAITGATISSNAVIDSLQKKALEVKALIEHEQ